MQATIRQSVREELSETSRLLLREKQAAAKAGRWLWRPFWARIEVGHPKFI